MGHGDRGSHSSWHAGRLPRPHDPFLAHDDDFFATLCNFALTSVLFLCLTLKQAALVESVEGYLTEEMYSLYYFDSGVVSVVFVVVVVGAAAVVIGFVLLELTTAARKPLIRLKSTGKVPVLSLGEAHRWHLFLSHIWSTGQDANATIKRQLCLLLPGISIFLDVRRSLSFMPCVLLDMPFAASGRSMISKTLAPSKSTLMRAK